MLDRFKAHGESYALKLGSALKMERVTLEILELGVRNSSNRAVKELLSACLEDSRRQVETLESIFLLFGWKVSDVPAPAMEALEKDCTNALRRAEEAAVDAIVLQVALEAAHLEIGVYESLIIHAEAMARPKVVERLREILDSDQRAVGGIKAVMSEILGS